MKNRNRFIFLAGVVALGVAVAFFTAKKDPVPTGLTAAGSRLATAAAETHQPPAAPASSSQRRFSEMSLDERNRILNEIKKQDFPVLLQTWIDCARLEHDLRKQNIVGALLARTLQEAADVREVYEQASRFVLDDSNAVSERAELLHVLGQAATKESVELLLQSVSRLSQEKLRQTALAEIRSAGEQRWDSRFHEELSPALEQAWRESADKDLLTAVAVALAEVGAPAGIQQLLAPILNGGAESDVRVHAARRALPLVRNPDAVSVFTALLLDHPTADGTAVLVSGALSEMVDPSAARALLGWLQNADESAAPFARRYVVQTRMPAMLEAWEGALRPTVVFRSEQNREAIRRGLVEYRASGKSGF